MARIVNMSRMEDKLLLHFVKKCNLNVSCSNENLDPGLRRSDPVFDRHVSRVEWYSGCRQGLIFKNVDSQLLSTRRKVFPS